MITRLIVKLTRFALKRADLSLAERNLLTTTVLDRIEALPLRDMIVINEEGNLLVNGRSVNREQRHVLRESARALQKNQSRKFIREQVLFTAVSHGIHKLETIEQSFFSRAAIWFGQQEEDWIKLLANDPERELGPTTEI